PPAGSNAAVPTIGGPNLPIAAVKYNTVQPPTTPWVNPGTFTVKLTVRGKSDTQPLVVKQDPRVKTPALVMQQVYSLSKAMYYGAADGRKMERQAASLKEQIGKLKPRVSGAAVDGLAALEDKLGGLTGASTALERVMNTLQAADVRPTTIQLNTIARARANAAAVMTKWNAIKSIDLPALNTKLKAAGLSALTP